MQVMERAVVVTSSHMPALALLYGISAGSIFPQHRLALEPAPAPPLLGFGLLLRAVQRQTGEPHVQLLALELTPEHCPDSATSIFGGRSRKAAVMGTGQQLGLYDLGTLELKDAAAHLFQPVDSLLALTQLATLSALSQLQQVSSLSSLHFLSSLSTLSCLSALSMLSKLSV